MMKRKQSPVKINWNKIPNTDRRLLASTFLDAAKQFYEDPKNKEEFDEWLPRYRKEHALTKSTNA